MKKYIALGLATVMTLSLCACSKTEGKIELAEYKGLTAYDSDLDVESNYDTNIQSYTSAFATTKTYEKGKVGSSDTVNVDYVTTVTLEDGTDYELPADAGSETGAQIAMSTTDELTDEQSLFAADLVGKQVGKTVKIKGTFPDDYTGTSTDADGNTLTLAGLKASFSITINSRDVTKTPKYNDKFVKKHFPDIATTTKEFDEYMYRQLKMNSVMSNIWDDYVESCTVDTYDSEELESMETSIQDSFENTLTNTFSSNIDTYLEVASASYSDYEDRVEEKAKESLKQKMIIEEIANKEGLTVTAGSDEYKTLLKQYIEYNNTSEDTLTQYGYTEDTLAEMFTNQKVYMLIYDNIKVESGTRPDEDATTAAADESSDDTTTSAEETSAE